MTKKKKDIINEEIKENTKIETFEKDEADLSSQQEEKNSEKTDEEKIETEKNDELLNLKKEKEELFDKYQRILAEYDNFRKRTAKEKENIYTDATAATVETILPILDNLQKAMESCEERTPFSDGIALVLKSFEETFLKLGVEAIPTAEGFNPDFHNAVMHIEDENLGENVIVEEFMKGYKLKNKVIRHSMVKVAN